MVADSVDLGRRLLMTVSVRHRLEYVTVQTIRRGVRLLPRRLSLSVGTALGAVFYRLHRSRREIAVVNLCAAFPERSDTSTEYSPFSELTVCRAV